MRRGMNYIEYDYEAAYNKSIEDLNEFFLEFMLKNRYKSIYACKEIRAGEQLEIEIFPEFRSMDEVPPEGRIKNKETQKNLNNKNAVKYCQRLITHNFTNDDIWLTLTCEDEREPADMKEAVKIMSNYIRRINYHRKKRGLAKAKYLYVIEHDDDAKVRWHYHLIIDGHMDMDIVESLWKCGNRNQVRRLQKDRYGLTGMANYITKNKNRAKYEKRWNCSTGLEQFRVRKAYNKRKGGKGNYAPVGKFIDKFVRDKPEREKEISSWYPDYEFLESNVYFNDFNGFFYINARMRRRE